MTIDGLLSRLAAYALSHDLISPFERSYSINLALDVLNMDSFDDDQTVDNGDIDLEETLSGILDYAFEKGLIPENTTVYRDLFDTKIMNCFTPRPDEVIANFYKIYGDYGSSAATTYFYMLSQDSDYIRTYRVKKDLRWKTRTKYGNLDITINLSKPEKDPKAIAAAKNMKQSSYPKCMLCKENMGYRGRINHPARETIRLIPLFGFGLDEYYLQYSPYSYYNEHCIVFNDEHIPMVINHKCFENLLAFVKAFPDYMLGSNADLPIVGGSILTHDHYQGGRYIFPMFKAKVVEKYQLKGFRDVEIEYLKWPLSVLRIKSENEKHLIAAADKILESWRSYSDPECGIYAETDGVPHNTISPICHKDGDKFVFELALRNNITTDVYPLGVFHPHQECWHIKKENIGLIEAMGLAVLPSRLNKELGLLKTAMLAKQDFKDDPEIGKHYEWIQEILPKYPDINESNIDSILKKEVGLVFNKVLEYAGVYKQNKEGLAGIRRFVDYLNK